MDNAIQVCEPIARTRFIPQPPPIRQGTSLLSWKQPWIPRDSQSLIYMDLEIALDGYKVSPTYDKLLKGRQETIRHIIFSNWMGVSMEFYGLSIREGRRGRMVPVMFDRAIEVAWGKRTVYDFETLSPPPEVTPVLAAG